MQNRWVSPYREKYRSFSPYEMAKNGQLDELREFLDIYPDFLNKPWDGNGWHSPLIRHLDGLLDYSLSFESGSYLAGITALVLGVPLIPVVGTVGAYWSIEEDSEKKRYKGWTLLEFAAQTGKIAVAMHLVWLCDKHNIDLNRNPFLEVAARNGKHDFVSTLKREIKKLGKNRSNKNKAIELNKIANEATESLECRGVEILQAKSTLEDCNQRIKLLNSHMTIYEDKFKERSEQYIANLRAELVKSDNQINGEVIKWNEIVNGLIEMHKEIHGKSAEITKENNFRNDHAKRWDDLIAEVNTIRNRPGTTELAKKYCTAVIAEYEGKLSKFMELNHFEYRDNDVSKSMHAAIMVDLGGFKDNHKYLLERKFMEDGKDYSVAVLWGNVEIDMDGNSIEAALDIDAMPGGVDNRYDLFMDIRELIVSGENHNIKILAPCKLSNLLWVTLDIGIIKSGNTYTLSIMQHDPYGKGLFSEDMFEKIKRVINKKITHLNAQATVNTSPRIESPYPPRLQTIDKVSCGVVTVRDIEKRIQGLRIGGVDCYPVGVLGHCDWQRNRVAELEKANSPNPQTVPTPQPVPNPNSFFPQVNSSASMLSRQAKTFGYKCKDVPRDGDCLFYAVLDQLGLQSSAEEVRLLRGKVADFLSDEVKSQLVNGFIKGSKEVFITDVKNNHAWAGDNHDTVVRILSELFKVAIYIIRSDGQFNEHNKIGNFSNKIYLGYEVGVHYQSLYRDEVIAIHTRNIHEFDIEENQLRSTSHA